jgi:hypothetical protein
MEDEIIQKKFLMRNFFIQEQWKNQKQDGRTSGGTRHRYYGYKDERDEHQIEGGHGPEGAVAP